MPCFADSNAGEQHVKPRVKVLVAVWGASYIEAFTRLALPSLLAPGNLPALGDATRLEVCILTSERDIPLIEANPAIKTLRTLCHVGFLGIDDLLGSSIYGITLTLAYMRGIAAEGEDMVNVHFMFFNSDFILAAGSLQSLARHILAGHRCVMAPSFRAAAEHVEPLLQSRTDASRQVLAVPARELVGMALRHLHPTTVAKTINQGVFRSLYHNQLYWRVDKDTVLARFYLMFMLCIRPERVVRTASTYCDYGFAPELCPSGNMVFLTDSDEFFMLETQAHRHEAMHIRIGPHRIADIAGYLSEWTTREHRLFAKQDLIFHAANVPPTVKAFHADAERAIQELGGLLPPPRPHAFHPYWVGSLPLWRKEIGQHGGGANPPELEAIADVPVKRTLIGRIFSLARDVVRGSQGELKIWHAGWLDQRLIERVLRGLGRDSRILIVADNPPLATKRAQGGTIHRMTLRQARDAANESEVRKRYDEVLVFLRSEQAAGDAGEHSSALLPLLNAEGRLWLVVHDPGSEFMPAPLAEPLLTILAGTFDTCQVQASVEFVDGALQRQIRLGVRRLGQFYLRLGWAWTPVLALGGCVLLIASVLNHIRWLMRGNRGDQPDYCGTILLEIRRL